MSKHNRFVDDEANIVQSLCCRSLRPALGGELRP